jgi:hypothetical protein
MTTYISIDGLYEMHAEHRSYNECIQFEGDVCGECEKFAADLDAAYANNARLYNEDYADYITRRAALYASGPSGTMKINEVDLINAHAHAAGDDAMIPPPDGYKQAKAIASEYECPRCEDTGYTVFTWVDEGICFDCGGRSNSRRINPDRAEVATSDARGVQAPA